MGAFDFLVKKEAREPKKEPVSKKTVPQSITGEVHLPQEFEPSNLRPIGTDYNKYLEDAIRKHNQQGPDYLEFSDALARLNSQGGLDPVATEKLCRTINKVANQDSQNTVIISTHVLEPALAISDSVWIMGYETSTTTSNTNEGKSAQIPGAVIRYVEDLAAQDLAWHPEIRKDPRFTHMVEKIREVFQTL